MHPEHRIDEFTLDLSFTTTRLARREKAGLVSWISEDLLPALDTLFSYYSPGNQVLRFETLEFDLGKLDARHYQQQIREQLLEQFTRLLKSQMLALDPRALIDTPLVPLVPDTRAALQQLITYLSTGNITAHYAFNPADRYGDEKGRQQSQEKIHQQLFEQVIAQQDIAELLRQFPAHELLVVRLVKQFSTAQRLVLLRQLAPQQLPQVQALLDLLEFIGQQQGFFQTATDQSNEFLTTYASAAASPTTYFSSTTSLTAAQVFASKQTVLQQQLWQQVLLLALESPHASETIWLARLLEKLSNSLAIEKIQLHEFLLAIPLPLAQAHPLKQLQTRIAQLIQPVNPHTGTQPHNTADTGNLIGDNTDSYVATGKPLKYSLFLRKQEPLEQRSSFRPLIFMDTRVRGYDKKFIFQNFPSNAGVYAKQNSTAYLPAGSSPAELLPKDITNIPRALLQQKVAQALVRADILLLQTIWPTLVAREPELLFTALQHYLPQAEIRQQLMMQLPLSIQADIIGILAADIKPLFLRLQQMADELVNAMSAQAGNENNFSFIDSALTNGAEKINSESPTHLQRRLWEIAVGLLLNHSPATVSSPNTKNPDIFLHQLIEHYAHIGSLNAQWLQQLWRQVIQLSASMSTWIMFSSTSTAEKLIPAQKEVTQPFSTHSSIESATTSPKAESMLFEASINELSSIELLAIASFDNDSLISESNIIQQQFVVQQTSEAHIGNQQTISAASPTNLSATPQPENPLQHTASQQPNLDNISDHQLFDLCLRLKSGAVSWSQISFGVALLQRMIDSYIRLGHSATAENCRDFIAAIDHQAAATPAATEFYRAVLQALVADKLVDLEAIASVVAKSPQVINAGETDPVQTPEVNTTIATDVVRADNSDVQFQLADNQVSATESADSGVKLRVSKSTEETAAPNPAVTNNAHLLPSEKKEFIPANITAIAESLGADTQPHKQLQQLRLSAAQWQQLCATVIQRDTTIEIDAADLLQAIHNFANRTIYFDLYYRRVINALLQQQPLDLELFAKTGSDNAQNSSLTLTASTSISSTTTDLPIATSPLTAVTSVYTNRNNDDGDKDLLKSKSQIEMDQTEQLSNEDDSAVNDQLKLHIQHSTMNTHVQSLLAAAQPVEHLQQLHLNNHQWQEICRELILHQATMENDDASDLLQSIKTFAQQALNTASYYRKVVQALLQQQPLDLELFANAANTNTPNNSLELTAPASTGSATNDLPMATNPLTAAASVYTSDNNNDYIDLPKIQSQIDMDKAEQLPSRERSAVHEKNETKIQQSAIHAYVQSLLAAAQPVEHLQQLHLNNHQWQEICNELILHQAIMNTDAASDLLQSIKTFAQHALNTANYYRKVVHALLQQQAIDLELFANAANTNTPNNSLELTSPASTGSATNDLPMATNPLTAATSVYTSDNNGDKYSPKIQSQIDTTKTVQLSKEDRSPIHEQNETKIQQLIISTHVQSLLATAQPVEYLQQLHVSNDQWQDICSELILHQATMDTNAASDLLRSIKTFAQQALNTTSYYRKVVHALLQQQPLDLELFAKTESDNAQNSSLALTASTSISPTTTDLPIANNPIATTANADGFVSQHFNDGGDRDLQNLQTQIDTDRTVRLSTKEEDALLETRYGKTPPSKIKTPVQSLLAAAQPRDYLQQLHLTHDQWQDVCSELILHQAIMNTDAASDLLQSIKTFAQHALNTANYYRKIVHALLQQQPIDLELFSKTEGDNTQNNSLAFTASTSISPTTTDLPIATSPIATVANADGFASQHSIDGGDRDLQNTQSQIDTNRTVRLSTKEQDTLLETRYAKTLPSKIKTPVQSLLAAAQPVEHLQQLHLNNHQWQEICNELILHQAIMNTDAANDLLQSIKTFAQHALNTANYYRKIVHALLQQQPIDLELFANASGDNVHTYFNEAATTTAYLHTTKTQAINIHTTVNDQAADDPNVQSEHNTGEPQKAQQPGMPLTINTNTPLLTGSADSLRKPVISLAQLLSVETTFAREQLLALQQHINFLMQHATTDNVNEWLELLSEAKHHSQLIRAVPAHLLHQIVMRLQPATYPPLDTLVKVVNEAIALLAVDSNSLALKLAKWEFIFHTLFVVRPTTLDKNQLTKILCQTFATAVGIDDVQRLINLAERRVALLTPPARQQPAMRLQDLQGAQKTAENTYAWEAGIPISNAGQVLAAAFMPRLFAMLELTQEGKFVHPGAADRAAHLVQFMVSGKTRTPEYELTLNKILCGISTSLPISEGIEISEHEKNTIEQMLTSMIQHWKVLGSTSIAGLRETFFQRQGWLILEEDCWRLKVQERTFDMLLDRLPWSISLIKHSWMDKPMRVSWRDQS